MKQAVISARQVLRHILPLGIGAACCWALYNQLSDIDFATLWSAFTQVKPVQWILALVATALSFLAVARYDVIGHRHFQTGVSEKRATMTGATAIALGQTLGAGAIVGGFVRWRLLPDLGVVKAAKVTAFVTLSFMVAWAIVTATATVFLPISYVPVSVPIIVLTLSIGILVFAFFKPVLHRAGHRLELPTIKAMLSMLVLCIIDTFFAAVALWVLFPGVIDLSLMHLFPIYLVALGAAVLSGTPGGVGPFELTLLALMPFAPEAELMAAILAFRVVYYAIPAILGGVTLLRPMMKVAQQNSADQSYSDLDQTLRKQSARAELAVVRQNGGAILECEGGTFGVVRTGQTLTSIFDPVHAHADFTAHLRSIARKQNRIICKYKISARHALKARKAGWTVLHVSDEAMVAPLEHGLEGSSYRQLRRKLRTAEKAGVSVVEQNTGLPFADMKAISEAWEDRNGGAKGLSMGQFEEDYIQRQRVFLAWKDEQLVGFVTFHATAHEWCLDLMRILPGAPDGTMHQLVNTAIEAAAEENVPQLSLAAAPVRPPEGNGLEARMRQTFFAKAGGKGLRQFKDCFNPRWKPLYMAAPGRTQLMIAAVDLIHAIKNARPVCSKQREALRVPAY